MARKAFVPGTYVLGSQPIVEKDILGNRRHKIGLAPTLFLANGKPHGSHLLRAVPTWQPGQQVGVISHFRNAAARRRCFGDMTQADKKDLVQVPVYRGVSARFANEMRSYEKRNKRRATTARVKKMIMEGSALKLEETEYNAA